MAALVIGYLAPISIAVAATDPPPRPPDQEAPRVWAQAGWDPVLVVDVGLGTSRIPLSDAVGWTGEAFLQVPPVLVSDGRLSLGGGLGGDLAWQRRWIGATAGLYGTVRTADDATGDWVALGTTTVVRALGRAGRWAAGPEVSWAAAWATWHAPSDEIAHLYGDRTGSTFDAPRAGFYAGTSHRYRLGAATAVGLGRAWSLTAASGFAWTPHALHRVMDVPVQPMPFYAELGAGACW